MRIAFRADASLHIGSGHVMRCLALADALRERGAEILFVCREHSGHLCDFIDTRGYAVARLPAPAPTCGDGYAAWLGAPWEADAAETLSALRRWTAEPLHWLIVDHYRIGAAWEAAVKPAAQRLMVIDDLADRRHECELLLDQDTDTGNLARYDKLVPPTCTKLLGPRYALLRHEFAEARRSLRRRDGAIRRILVFFGGSDPGNETGKAVDALRLLARPEIAVDVVVGASNPYGEEIRRQCHTLANAHFHLQVSNMAALMAQADLALGAGGSAIWERCCLGLPSILSTLAINQRGVTEHLARHGVLTNLGDAACLGAEHYRQAMQAMFDDPARRRMQSRLGMDLVNGSGVDDVITYLIE